MVVYDADRVSEYNLKQKDICWKFRCCRGDEDLGGYEPTPRSMQTDKRPHPSHLIDEVAETDDPPLYIPLSHAIAIPGFGNNSLPQAHSGVKNKDGSLFRRVKTHNPRPVFSKNRGHITDRTEVIGWKMDELKVPGKESKPTFINPLEQTAQQLDPHYKPGFTTTHWGGFQDEYHTKHVANRGFARAPGGAHW
eukprot:Rmarinus@m.7799